MIGSNQMSGPSMDDPKGTKASEEAAVADDAWIPKRKKFKRRSASAGDAFKKVRQKCKRPSAAADGHKSHRNPGEEPWDSRSNAAGNSEARSWSENWRKPEHGDAEFNDGGANEWRWESKHGNHSADDQGAAPSHSWSNAAEKSEDESWNVKRRKLEHLESRFLATVVNGVISRRSISNQESATMQVASITGRRAFRKQMRLRPQNKSARIMYTSGS